MSFSPVELLSMLPESSFQLEQNGLKQSILLQDAQIPQEVKNKLSSLLEVDYNSTVSKSTMDVVRANLFQMAFLPEDPSNAHKPYGLRIEHQKFMDEEIRLLENAGCISK